MRATVVQQGLDKANFKAPQRVTDFVVQLARFSRLWVYYDDKVCVLQFLLRIDGFSSVRCPEFDEEIVGLTVASNEEADDLNDHV